MRIVLRVYSWTLQIKTAKIALRKFMKKLLGILVLGLLWCNTAFSVESLTEGQKGTIKFESIPVITFNQFLKGETIGDSVQISG